jgi:hypothetical protein
VMSCSGGNCSQFCSGAKCSCSGGNCTTMP